MGKIDFGQGGPRGAIQRMVGAFCMRGVIHGRRGLAVGVGSWVPFLLV